MNSRGTALATFGRMIHAKVSRIVHYNMGVHIRGRCVYTVVQTVQPS